MYESKAYFYGTGRRKHSVSRVRLYPGTGKVTINDRDIDEYFGLDTLKPVSYTHLDVYKRQGGHRPDVQSAGEAGCHRKHLLAGQLA